MTPAQKALASASEHCDRLKKVLHKSTTKQVRSDDETQVTKATAHAWFNNCRPVVLTAVDDGQLKGLDDQYRALIAVSERATLRSRYFAIIKQTKKLLSQVQVGQLLPWRRATPNRSMQPRTTHRISARWSQTRRCKRFSSTGGRSA